MRLSEAILRYLKNNGVEYIFGIPAGNVSPLYDSLNDVDIKLIVSKNEAGSTYCAARYANISKKLGVCILAGGVGINNGINGIADAMIDKAPVLIISGYIKRENIGKGAIQELDTQHMLKPITKYSKTIFDENEVLNELQEAIRLALTPPFGPVHLSIPLDIQMEALNGDMPDPVKVSKTPIDLKALDRAKNIIEKEEKGLILVGKYARGLTEEIKKLSLHLRWPIITSSGGKGVVPEEFEMNLGNYGFSGTDSANDFVDKADYTCLLVLGCGLGEASTRNFNNTLVKDKRVIHIDSDKKELDRVFTADVGVVGDVCECINYLLDNTAAKANQFTRPENFNQPYVLNHTGLSFRLFVEKITGLMPKNTYYVCDLGETMNFVFKYLHLTKESDFEININYASMGSSVGGAVGAHLASPNKRTAVIVGDGSYFMNGMEILSAKEYNLPIVYFVVNNAKLGYVDRGHEYLYKRSRQEFKQQRVSIKDITKAMNIPAIEISKIEDMKFIPDFIKDVNGPCLVEVITDGTEPAPIMDRIKALKR
ncbi:thiamine pyrophosphate-binding protein [Alkaliphilus hydrothermalis]|uniref:Acetolactate synthase-1/2/3 large subunit n=1 Tax=Alkaliphilus hydrothermalis TaxID=1482730 RepID=A0ABS2NPW6_9FIRM|nr:thiamine pyrophosphate-binding protein [Alkaliphilus hydrothermalis]MBM7614916.1 acetolactate synthase-1/2/3 large subunit [Alkaliphilus hydrothermalis]